MSIGIPTTVAKEEVKPHPVTSEVKIVSVQYNLMCTNLFILLTP